MLDKQWSVDILAVGLYKAEESENLVEEISLEDLRHRPEVLKKKLTEAEKEETDKKS